MVSIPIVVNDNMKPSIHIGCKKACCPDFDLAVLMCDFFIKMNAVEFSIEEKMASDSAIIVFWASSAEVSIYAPLKG